MCNGYNGYNSVSAGLVRDDTICFSEVVYTSATTTALGAA